MEGTVIINQVFQPKTLVIKMAGGWAVSQVGSVNISFRKHNSATLRNILMVLGRIIEQVNADCRCKNDNSATLVFLITSPYPFLHLVSGLSLSNYLKYFNDTL